MDEPGSASPVADAGASQPALGARVVRGSAWILGGRVGTALLGVVVNGLLARLLTPTQLGAYFTAFTLVVWGGAVSQLGLDVAVVRFVATLVATGHGGRARDVIRRVVLLGTVGAVVVALVLLLGVGRLLGAHVFHSSLVTAAIPAAAGWLVATAVQSLLVESFRGLQRFSLSTVFDTVLVQLLAATVFAAVLATGARVSLPEVLWTLAGLTAAVCLLAGRSIVGVLARLAPGTSPSPAIDTSTGSLMRVAWPLLIANLTFFLVGSGVDIWVIAAFRPESDVALYGAAVRAVVLVTTPFLIVQGVAPPIMAELHARGLREELQRTARATATLAGIPAFAALLAFVVAGRPILGLVYGAFYRRAALVLAILSVGRLVGVWTGPSGVALMMTGHQRSMMNISLATGIASVGGGIAVAPHFGTTGVAVVTTVCVIASNTALLVAAHRRVGIWTHAELSLASMRDFFGAVRSRVDRRT